MTRICRTGFTCTFTDKETHCVPNLKLNLLRVDIDHASSKLDANRQVVHWLKALVRELKKQT